MLTYKLRTVLNELQWHALLNGPVFRVYIAFLREISDDNGAVGGFFVGGMLPSVCKLESYKAVF